VGGRPVAIYLQARYVVNVLSIDADVADDVDDVDDVGDVAMPTMPISLRLYYQQIVSELS
jgi:hypothetical protein